MNRDLILESFQALSEIQDFEECIQILESVDWNLDSALNSVERSDNFTIPELESHNQFPLESAINSTRYVSAESRDLMFNVDIRGQTIQVSINEDKTVGDLAKLVASHINEPHTKFKINGLKMPYDDNAILRSLKLPQISNVVANSVDHSFVNSASSSISSQSSRKCKLSIDVYYNDEFRQKLDLLFEENDSIGKVKSYIASLLGTSLSKQKWIGWPIHALSDETLLQRCSTSDLASLKVYVTVDQKLPKCVSRLRTDYSRPTAEASLNNSRLDDIDNDDDDNYYDYQDDIELMEQETEWGVKRSLALMNQDAHNDAMTATLYFSTEFSSRYCSEDRNGLSTPKPPFFIGTIEDALGTTLNLPPKQRKPLFIYLHHGESIQANIFCTQVLCYSDIVLYFTQSDFMIWPWDITYSENKTQLLTWLTRNFGTQVTSLLRIMLKDQFPVLLALGKSQGNVEVLEMLDGSKSKDEILIHLWSIKSQFQERQTLDILAWEEQESRKRVKMEQDAAYQESLSKDQVKEKERDDRKRKIEEDEKNKRLQIQKSEEDRKTRMLVALNKVPTEPNDGDEVITIRLKLPPNLESAPSQSALTRRFLYSHTLAQLMAYVESLGFFRNEFKLLLSYPRTNLTQIEDQNVSLKSLGMPKREILILERL